MVGSIWVNVSTHVSKVYDKGLVIFFLYSNAEFLHIKSLGKNNIYIRAGQYIWNISFIMIHDYTSSEILDCYIVIWHVCVLSFPAFKGCITVNRFFKSESVLLVDVFSHLVIISTSLMIIDQKSHWVSILWKHNVTVSFCGGLYAFWCICW